MNWMTLVALLFAFSKVLAGGVGVCLVVFNLLCLRRTVYLKYLIWMVVCLAWVVATWKVQLPL